MKYIAHRGLITGPNPELENLPYHIEAVLEQGYDCEIDLWVRDNLLWLGHDLPQFQIGHEFLLQQGLWIHCKNFEALDYCQHYPQLNYFWHDADAYTLTSWGYIWAYPGQPTGNKSVQVCPEMIDRDLGNINWSAYAVCSDWILKLQDQRPKSL